MPSKKKLAKRLARSKERCAELEADVENLLRIMSPDLSISDMGMEIRDGAIRLSAPGGPEGGHPGYRLLAGIIMSTILDDEGNLPPNYMGIEWTISPAGDFDRYRVVSECIPPGGRSSHEVRMDLEAELEELWGKVRRIRLQRTKGWRKPDGAVVVARPSKWGNPFTVGEPVTPESPYWALLSPLQDVTVERDPWRIEVPDRFTAVNLFRHYASGHVGESGYTLAQEARTELAGRALCCWCPETEPCHADVLLELANPRRAIRFGALTT